ncbi:MAG: hypothetical protein IPI49_31600 [Myxococcales bacterium]|nr:hypothetical protein [Myxococcales bacterium]HRC58628.1 hypothetical protein [Kofleriaceae bacterium]
MKGWRTSAQSLDELRLLIDELRASFAEQRRAISRLAGERVSWLVGHQSQICSRIESLLTAAGGREGLPEPLRNIMAAVRIEAEATALLAAIAAHSVRNLIEQSEPAGYNATARPTRTTSPICLLTTL